MSKSIPGKKEIWAGPYPAFLLAVTLTAVWFFSTIKGLTDSWGQAEYSHAPLVVGVAFLLAWRRLARRPVQGAPSWGGVPLIVMGAVCFAIGQLSAFNSGSAYGLVLVLSGLILGFFGGKVLRVTAPAILYLLFAIPLPQFIFVSLTADMQLISSSLGVKALDLIGVPVYQEGNIIDLGSLKLQIVEACSGLRYMFPLLSFSYLAAYLFEDRWWKRGVLFVSAVPITILLNVVRIALTGITADRWGVEVAQGFIHEFEGWVIFLACVAVLLGEGALLRLIPPRGRFNFEELTPPRGALLAGEVRFGAASASALLLALAITVGFASGALLPANDEVAPPHRAFRDFPLALGEWQGKLGSVDPEVLASLNLSDYFIADFQRPSSPASVDMYVAYFDRQRIGASAHSPSNCIPGGGWRIMDSSVRVLPLPWRHDGERLKVSRITIAKGGQKALVYYWFDERGRDLTEVNEVKWNLLRDSLLVHRTDGALIRIVSGVGEDGEEAAESRMMSFIETLNPVLLGFMPAPLS